MDVQNGKGSPGARYIPESDPRRNPSAAEFEAALDEAQAWAVSVGYREEDVNELIKTVRKGK